MVEWLNALALHKKPISELRSLTYHRGSHRVTCHLTRVNAHCLSHWYSIYLPQRDGRL